jgi:ankyrin repeat protein
MMACMKYVNIFFSLSLSLSLAHTIYISYSEDADRRVVELLLHHGGAKTLNQKIYPPTYKWKVIYMLAKLSVRTGLRKSVVLQSLAERCGRTALHYAARRADLDIVELLLSEGADVNVQDSMGRSVQDVCTSFPELKGMLQKRTRIMMLRKTSKIRGTVKPTKCVGVLRKRISTATPIQHEMWLISLETVLMLYGKDSHGQVMDVHQELKKRGFLTRWHDVTSDSEIVFVSHEWLSWAHPDPEGNQLRVLCRVLERLKKGGLNTDLDPVHTIMYKYNFTTKGKDWKAMLKRTYLWVDWFSMPQPGAEKEENIGTEKMAVLKVEGSMAIRSIPAYVERSDFIMILVPSLYHSDRKVPTCYRTWRRRGWCLLELYAAVMARDSSNPPLLVRSEKGTPMWMSPFEVMKLSIGLADFTCCQRNHVITTETQKIMSGEKNMKKISCDKPIAGGILEQLINAKINDLFNVEGDLVVARVHCVFKHWWMRGLKEEERFVTSKEKSAVEKFKKKLRWNDDNDKWFDCGGMGVLTYAACGNEVNVVRELLQELKENFKGVEYTRRLESRVRDEGYVTLGIPGGGTALMTAMMSASPEVILMLLDCGANVESMDVIGNDAVMFASACGRFDNLKCWLEKIKDYDLDHKNAMGVVPLGYAVTVGSHKLETFKILVDAGANLRYQTFTGCGLLEHAASNEDADPKLLKFILEHVDSQVVNLRRRPTTLKWHAIYFSARAMYRAGLANQSGILQFLAMEGGMTPLSKAVQRGDVEIVELLLEAGADPYVANDLGMNAFQICEHFGPFPGVTKALLRKKNDRKRT